MNSSLESTLLRAIAVLALVAAAVLALYITVNSGVMGDDAASAPETAMGTTADSGDVAQGETPAETGTTSQKTYEVKPGDSFALISEQHNTDIATIMELNPNVNPQNLKPGTVLVVP